MNEYFQENKRSLLLLTGLFFILAIVLYFMLLRPLLTDLASKEKAIKVTKADIQLLEAKVENFEQKSEKIDVDQLEMANKIPTEKELDDYILWLQKLEAITGSKLEKIDFTYDSNVEFMEEETAEGASIDEEIEGLADIDDESDGSEDEEPTIDPDIINEKPEGLEIFIVKVKGYSKNFEDFIDFLEAIEQEERISFVSQLKFVQPTKDDINFSEYPFIALSFEAELTTFYYPD